VFLADFSGEILAVVKRINIAEIDGPVEVSFDRQKKRRSVEGLFSLASCRARLRALQLAVSAEAGPRLVASCSRAVLQNYPTIERSSYDWNTSKIDSDGNGVRKEMVRAHVDGFVVRDDIRLATRDYGGTGYRSCCCTASVAHSPNGRQWRPIWCGVIAS
jgi:hypothetical protein